MAALDGEGRGLFHVSNHTEQPGRKYWVWGNAPHNVERENFLSSPGNGRYIEMQAGVRSRTQESGFPMRPGEGVEWTEALGPIEIDPALAHGDYHAALAAAQARDCS